MVRLSVKSGSSTLSGAPRSREVRASKIVGGRFRKSAALPPSRNAASTPQKHPAAKVARSAPSISVVRRGPMSSSDYAALDKPTVQRQRAVGDGLRPEAADPEEMLDIPAFLRRQAD